MFLGRAGKSGKQRDYNSKGTALILIKLGRELVHWRCLVNLLGRRRVFGFLQRPNFDDGEHPHSNELEQMTILAQPGSARNEPGNTPAMRVLTRFRPSSQPPIIVQ